VDASKTAVKLDRQKRRARRQGREPGSEESGGKKKDDPEAVRAALWGTSGSTSSKGGGEVGVGGGQVQEEDTRTNTDVLSHAIKVASEATVIGAETGIMLEQQTEQLHRMDHTLAEINASLQRSERILKGMESWTASVRKGWTSFIPEPAKLFTKTRADVEAEPRDKDFKDHLDDEESFSLPSGLERNEPELAKVMRRLEEKKKICASHK